MSRRLLGAAVLAAAPLCLSACSNGGDAPVAAVAADSRAHTGSTLRVGILRPTTIDPQLLPTGDTAGALVVRTMCDPLIGTDPQTRELSPAVAKSWRVLGSAGVQVTLRKGVTFSDGSPVTARDVVATLQRVVNPDVVSPQAHQLSTVLGYPNVQEGKTEAKSFAGVRSNSNDTLQISLYTADSQFVRALTLPFATPVPRGLAARAGFSAHPVCVGPYALSGSYTGVEPTITLVRSSTYSGIRPALTRGGAGWADKVQFRVYPTQAAILAALGKGEIDAGQLGAQQVIAAKPQGVSTVSVPTSRLEYVGLPNKAPFTDPLVDAAISQSLDRETLNAAAQRAPAFNLVPPTLPDSVLPEARIRDCQLTAKGNLAQARALLAQAQVGTSLGTFPFYYNNEFTNPALAAELKRQLATIGLTITGVPVSFDNLIARGEGTGGFDGLFRMATTGDEVDQAQFVLSLVSVDALGKTNFAGFNGELISQRIRNKLMDKVPVDQQRTASLAVTASTCAVPIVPIGWYQNHLGLASTVVVAAHGAIDRGTGYPELRELAVG